MLPKFKTVTHGKNSIKYQSSSGWNNSILLLKNHFIRKYGNDNRYNNFLSLNKHQFSKLIKQIL